MRGFSAGCALLGLTLLTATALAQTQSADLPASDKDAVTGTMDIQFTTRTNQDDSGDLKAGSAKLGAKDQYTVNLMVVKAMRLQGQITRQPNLYSKLIQRKKQEAQLGFDLKIQLLNPQDPSKELSVGNWVGIVPIDPNSGAYELAGGKKMDSPLRIHIDSVGRVQGFDDAFAGKLVGKAEKKENLAGYTYKRLVGNKEVSVTVKRVDPMRFEGIELAKGPTSGYPRTTVNGRLDYDYETGNWLTDGISFRYSLNGKDYEDKVTGTIKWVEDPQRKTNGKGYYEFNLRFNEDKNRKADTEAAAFEKMNDVDAFFAVDESIPTLTGRINYVDTMSGETVSASKVSYDLKANKLNRQQVVNFVKLWLLATGPTNDE